MVKVALELVPTSGGGGGKMSGSGIFQEVAGCPGYGFPKQSHLSEMGFAEQLPGHELMGVYFNDRIKGFWAEQGAMRSTPMNLLGLKPSFMITLMASGRGGPMLLLLNGRLVGSGVW